MALGITQQHCSRAPRRAPALDGNGQTVADRAAAVDVILDRNRTVGRIRTAPGRAARGHAALRASAPLRRGTMQGAARRRAGVSGTTLNWQKRRRIDKEAAHDGVEL